MAKIRTRGTPAPLMVRLDEESKDVLVRAAELRQISVSDYVRQITVTQARKEVVAAAAQTIAMTPDEQLAFWTALHQKKWGRGSLCCTQVVAWLCFRHA